MPLFFLVVMTEEDQIHIAIVELLKLRKILHFHVPNQSKSSIQYRVKLKRMGLISGVPDLVLILDDGNVGFIEVKTSKGRLSPSQKEFGEECAKRCVFWGVARSVDDADALVNAWTGG